MEKAEKSALKAELLKKGLDLGVSTVKMEKEVGNNGSLITEKSTKFVSVDWSGKAPYTHLRFTTDANETCSLSNLLTFGVPVSEKTKEDLVIEKSTSTGAMKDKFVLKGTRCLNNVKSGELLDVAIDLLDKPFTVESVDCHVGGFKQVGDVIGFDNKKDAVAALSVKTIYKLTFA